MADTRNIRPTVTSPQAWEDALVHHDPPPMPPMSGHLVVVAAHPDDETLAAGGLLQAVRAGGGRITLVVATDGEAAFGPADPALGRARVTELEAALTALGLDGHAVHRPGLPDGGLAGAEDELAALLAPLLADADACLAPWTGDPHPDHAAAGRAALRAAPAGVHRWAYPLWALPWGSPEDPAVPWGEAAVHHLDGPAREAKRRAIAAFTTRVGPAPDGGPPILPADVLAHLDTSRELFFRVPRTDTAPLSRFTALSAADADPWGVSTRWYERRKRVVLLSCLPRESYRHAAEPACGLGMLTERLAARCERVTASDPAPAAAAATRARTAGLPGVEVHEVAIAEAQALPAGADLVVLSELLYYLTPAEVDEVAGRIATTAAPGADVVLVHWRGRPPEAPQDAERVHARFTADPRFTTLVAHVDEEFLLHVVRRTPAAVPSGRPVVAPIEENADPPPGTRLG